jgi:Ca-activated chloride channel family protein
MHRITRLLFAVCVVAVAATAAARYQDDERVVVDSRLVTVNVSVTDSRGRHVAGLTSEQFEVFDDNARRPVEQFSAAPGPFTLGIVYDIHSSNDARVDETLRALRRFTGALGGGDRFFLMIFNGRGSVTLGFVPTAEQVAGHLTYASAKEPSALYDAVFTAAERVSAHPSAKKALLIISDGGDHNSRHSHAEVHRRVREFNVQVYGIAVADTTDNTEAGRARWTVEDLTRRAGERAFASRGDAALGRAALEEFARTSGGVYFPDDGRGGELAELCARVALDLRSQYTLAFRPSDVASEKKWRAIRVRINRPGGSDGLRLSYRKGYRSPER